MQLRARLGERFWPWLALWTAVGLGVRLGSVFGRPNRSLGGDPYSYFWTARLLVKGMGFINPWLWNGHQHVAVQTAAYPPGYTLLLTIPMVLGWKSFFASRIFDCLLGTAGVFFGALAGREVAGRRVGLLAGFFLAIYPNVWMSDEMGAAETIDPLVVSVVLITAYRFWKRPDLRRALWLGLALGATMLCRDELTLLVVFILVPLALLARAIPWRRRFAAVGVGLLAAGIVVAPWVGYNMSRFEKPVFISNGLGVTLVSADCNTTFSSGPLEGYWSMPCALAAAVPKHGDESVANAAYEHDAVEYLKHHESRLLPVTLAKIGRAFGLFRPIEQINLDSLIETRPERWALVGLYMYYGFAVLTLAGTVILRRRRIPSFPMWAVGLNVLIAVVTTFGNTRYRCPFEVCLVIMASVTIEWAWSRLRPRTRVPRGQPAVPPASDERAPVLSGTPA